MVLILGFAIHGWYIHQKNSQIHVLNEQKILRQQQQAWLDTQPVAAANLAENTTLLQSFLETALADIPVTLVKLTCAKKPDYCRVHLLMKASSEGYLHDALAVLRKTPGFLGTQLIDITRQKGDFTLKFKGLWITKECGSLLFS